jgi:hypothetical protein
MSDTRLIALKRIADELDAMDKDGLGRSVIGDVNIAVGLLKIAARKMGDISDMKEHDWPAYQEKSKKSNSADNRLAISPFKSDTPVCRG